MVCSCTGTHAQAAAPEVMPQPTAAPPATSTAAAPAGPAFVVAGRTSAQTPLAAGRHTTATPGRIELLTPGDAALVDAALAELRRSPSGAPVLSALQQFGVRVKVLGDAEFAQLGHEGSGAWFDATQDVMYVRREWLQKNPAATASVIAHEGVHAIDDASGLLQGAREARARQLAAMPGDSPTLIEQRVQQAMWELSVASEARAFLVQGQVLRELDQVQKASAGGAIAVAAAGANDRATYDRVFQTIVTEGGSAYNPEGRSAAPFPL